MEDEIKVERHAVRQLVKRLHDEIEAAKRRGENEHQLSLDQIDWISAKISHMSPDMQEDFWRVFYEEQNVFYDKLISDLQEQNDRKFQEILEIEERTEQILRENERTEENYQAIGGVVGLIVLILFLAMLFS